MGGAIQEGVTSLIRRIASEIVEYLFFTNSGQRYAFFAPRYDTAHGQRTRLLPPFSTKVSHARRESKPGVQRVQALADISRSRYVVIVTQPVQCAPTANPPNTA